MMWVVMLAMMIWAIEAVPEAEVTPPDSTQGADSLGVDEVVPLDLLRHLDLLLDLDLLEYADTFGDADVSSFVEPDSVASEGGT